MAVFKIIASRRGAEPDSAEFEIELISGDVAIGDEFQCLDTHHPINYRVRAIQNSTANITLSCAGFYGYDDYFVGATIDTSKKGRLGFRYDVA
jgi:hypothetical protein